VYLRFHPLSLFFASSFAIFAPSRFILIPPDLHGYALIMSDAPTTRPALPNPLLPLHQAAGAEFQNYADLEVPLTFGEPQAEYAAVRTGCGLIDMPQRGLLELTGKDRLPFLNNLLTNQTWDKETKQGMPPGTGVYAFFLNAKGRIVLDVNVLDLGDRTLLEMDARLVEDFRKTLDKYLFTEQVTIANRTGQLHSISLHGPTARQIVGETTGQEVGGMAPLACIVGRVDDVDAVVWRDDVAGVPGYHLVLSTAEAPRVWQSLLQRFGQPDGFQTAKRRLRPFGWAVYNTTRIEAGRPLFAIDFDDSVLPAETGQVHRAVSLTKGCYMGQEIVARMHARSQVARKLVGLRMDDDALPIAGAQLFDDQSNAVGGITSSTVSPILSNACIALGYVKKPLFEEGTKLTVPAEGAMRKVTVAKLPFVSP
jgi:aminomethyltransferase